MKLLKAIEDKLIKSGDFFKTKLDNWFLLKGTFFYHYDPVLEKQKGSANLCIDTLNLEGEIIRAEPEVLTAKEILSKIDVKCSFFSDTSWVHVVDAIELSDKNGQIKEYKRLKPLIDAANKMISYGRGKRKVVGDNAVCTLHADFFDDFINALENLTPPWEPEK